MDKGYSGLKSELIQARKSRDDWKRKYHQLNNLYAQLKAKCSIDKNNEGDEK